MAAGDRKRHSIFSREHVSLPSEPNDRVALLHLMALRLPGWFAANSCASADETLNLSSGWFTLLNYASYANVSVDNRTAPRRWVFANTDRQVQGARAAAAYCQQRVEFRFLLGERAADCRRSANLFSFGISARASLRTHLPRQGSSCPRPWLRGDA